MLRLRRAIYGLRKAPRAWGKRLEAELTRLGFVQSNADPALWLRLAEDGTVLTMFYVDDGLVAARTACDADALVDLVTSVFQIRQLEKLEDALGIKMSCD